MKKLKGKKSENKTALIFFFLYNLLVNDQRSTHAEADPILDLYKNKYSLMDIVLPL